MARTLWPEPGTNHMPHLKGTVEDLFSKDLRTLRPQWTRGAPHHESRRIKKRPWNADPVLSDLLERNILGGGSWAIQQRSTTWIFCQPSDSPIHGERSRNLQQCKHQSDSLQKPLGRSCLFTLPNTLWGGSWTPKNLPKRQSQQVFRRLILDLFKVTFFSLPWDSSPSFIAIWEKMFLPFPGIEHANPRDSGW